MEQQNREFTRIMEIENYYNIQKVSDVTIIALAFFANLSIEQNASSFIISLSLVKLFLLLIFSLIENKFYENISALVVTRTIQFWMYRFIFFIQLILLVAIVVTILT